MATLQVFQPVAANMERLWPQTGGTDIAQVLQSDAGSYWIQLLGGVYVRYSGSGLTYAGVPPVPTGGTYDTLEVTDAAGTVLYRLDGFGTQSAADVVNAPAAVVLGNADVLTGGTLGDRLSGYDGNDS